MSPRRCSSARPDARDWWIQRHRRQTSDRRQAVAPDQLDGPTQADTEQGRSDWQQHRCPTAIVVGVTVCGTATPCRLGRCRSAERSRRADQAVPAVAETRGIRQCRQPCHGRPGCAAVHGLLIHSPAGCVRSEAQFSDVVRFPRR